MLLLASCSLAPEYHVPPVAVSSAYKESKDWKPAQPADTIARGSWWEILGSRELNDLETKAAAANEDVRVMLARYQEARAASSFARADYFPTLQANAGGSRNKVSLNAANAPSKRLYNDYAVSGDFSYEIDLWGRVRNRVAAADYSAEAARADMIAAQLSVSAELADDYVALRADDASQRILDETVDAYGKALELTRSRFKGGIASQIDVDQAQVQLENARTQAADMHLKRAQLEHAIAVLTGGTPSLFTLPPAVLAITVPDIGVGIPSRLLERRPDVAAAERRVAAANANIGVARAAWFPSVNLLGSFGVESASAGNLFTAPSELWALGPSILFAGLDAGRISALSRQAKAAYEEAAAHYRSVALNAYREVEDSIVAIRQLRVESMSQAAATQAAARVLTQAQDRYAGGIDNYLDVVAAQNADLQARLASIDLEARLLVAEIQLIRALGGGWKTDGAK